MKIDSLLPRQGMPAGRRLRLVARSLFLQSSWNYLYFQGLGWAVVLLPELRRLYPLAQLGTVVDRYLKYFNTNTFLAPALAAATLNLERKQIQGQPIPMTADAFAAAVMAPCAAVGDALFWGGLRPLLSCAAVLCALLGFWWAPFLLFVLFNLPAGVFRVYGAWLGDQRGADVVLLIQRWRLADIAVGLKQATVVVAGGVCAALSHGGDVALLPSACLGVGLLCAVLVAGWCLQRRVPVVVILVVGLAVTLLFDVLLFS